MNARDAVVQSLRSYGEVFPPNLQDDLRLEEVRLSDDENLWLTTLSVRNPEHSHTQAAPEPAQNSLAALFNASPAKRIFKTIRLRSSDGTLRGIVDAR